MADRKELERLAERVERGDRQDGWNMASVLPDKQAMDAAEAVGGSLDACAALHEAVLGEGPDVDLEMRFAVGLHDATIFDLPGGDVRATASTPARAWTAAILRAAAQEGK